MRLGCDDSKRKLGSKTYTTYCIFRAGLDQCSTFELPAGSMSNLHLIFSSVVHLSFLPFVSHSHHMFQLFLVLCCLYTVHNLLHIFICHHLQHHPQSNILSRANLHESKAHFTVSALQKQFFGEIFLY